MTDEMQKSEPKSGTFFVPIMKVDEEQRIVYGYATVEEPDHSNEVMDYATSKPYFVKWSDATKARSGGKSLGNVRAMHNMVAAGKIVQMDFDDENRAVFIGVKVTNNQEWDQVREGVYTGFSIGGRYAKRWFQNGYMRYTAEPREVSLVDMPNVPHATFQLVKADGATEEVEFKKASLPDTPTTSPMPVDGSMGEVVKGQETFSPVTVNINLLGGNGSTEEFRRAVVPGEQTVNIPVTASPVTDNGPGKSTVQEQSGPVLSKGEGKMDFETLIKAASLIQSAAASLTTNPDGASSAVNEAVGLLGVSMTGTTPQPATVGEEVGSGIPSVSGAPSMDKAAAPSSTTSTTSTTSTMDKAAEPDSDDTKSTTTTSTVEKAAEPSSTTTSTTSSTMDKAAEPDSTTSNTPTSSEDKASTVTKNNPDHSGNEMKSDVDDLKKGDETMSDQATPMATVPPTAANFTVDGSDVVSVNLAPFMTALEHGSLRKAQAIVRDINGGYFDQAIFDEMFVKAQHKLLTDGGWTYNNLKKGQLNREMILGGANPGEDMELKKAIQIGDIPNIYLIRLVKLMLPLYAGLRRRLPSVPPAVGADKAQWRAELGTSNFSFATAMSVAEASIGQAISESFLTFASPFMRIALNDAVTLEAVYGTRGYDDPMQIAVIRALTLLLGTEERKILGDNGGSIAAPSGITATSSSTGGTLAAATYTPYVSALTYRGWLAGSKGGSAPTGETTATSATAQTVTGSTSSIALTWTSIKNAVAYNVYASNGSNDRWIAMVTIPKYTITAFPGAGTSHPASDTSANTYGFEGIISWCDNSPILGNTIPNKTFTDQLGSGLTTYAGGVTEFDTLLSNLWTNWQVAPSLIVTSPNGAKHLTKQVLSTSNVSGYRIEVGAERGSIAGGMFVTGYTNKFAPYADGSPRVIDIMAHPYMPDGSYKFLTESITYPMARESRGFVLETLIPYTYFPLAQTDIRYPFSMLVSETLECFHPGAQAAINGVDITQ